MARPPSPSCWDSGKAPGERRARAAHPPSARLSGAPWRGRRGCFAFGLRCRMMGVVMSAAGEAPCAVAVCCLRGPVQGHSGGVVGQGLAGRFPSPHRIVTRKSRTKNTPCRPLGAFYALRGKGAPQVMGFPRLPSGLRHTPAVFHSFHIQFGPRPFGGDSGIGRRGLCSRSARGVRFPGVPGGSQRGGC